MLKSILVAALCFVSAANAQVANVISQGTLVILEGTTTPLIPLASISNIEKVKQNLKIVIDGPAYLVSKKTNPTTDKSGTIYLDSINAGPFSSISEIQLQLSKKALLKISVSSTNKEYFDFIGQNPRNYQNAILARGQNWYLIDETKVQTSFPAPTQSGNSASLTAAAASASTDDDRGTSTITYDLEDGGATINPRSICIRFFDPFTGNNHRNHYGINLWKISNPIPAGFSLKEEFTNSLRCPHQDYRVQEDFIDGVYKRAWGTTAYKVPNHCTSVRYPGYMSCCCNSALTPLYGICRYVATAPIDWPAKGLSCR